MKVAIFGTGRIFNRYWKYIKEQAVCLVDNDKAKAGRQMEGMEIILPQQLKEVEYDVILILCAQYEAIRTQLVGLGILDSIIYSYRQIGNITRRVPSIWDRNGKCTIDEWIVNHYNNRKVILISHELSYSGAPIALMNMAKVMQKMGMSVLYTGINEGALKKELVRNNIDYVSDWLFADEGSQKEYIREMDLVVICTLGMKWLLQRYKEVPTPVIWWLHEAEIVYQKDGPVLDYGENVHVCCGGRRAQKTFQAYYEGNHASILQYCIPEGKLFIDKNRILGLEKIRFGIFGSICERKGQDIFLRALSLLPSSYQAQIEVSIIGSVLEGEQLFWEEQETLLNSIKNVRIMGEMSQEEIAKEYKEIEVLVCPSRDDPMPVVVTEAMMYGKACMVSKNVGQADFITSQVNGFIFESERELSEQIKWIADHKEALYDIGILGRKIYEQNFTEKIMIDWLEGFWQRTVDTK